MIRTIVAAAVVLLAGAAAAAAHPSPPSGFEATLIGVLDVPFIYDVEPADPKPAGPTRLDARAEPFETAPVVATLDRDGIAWYRIALDPDGRRFGWVRSAARYLDLTALVVTQERLTYLTPAWRGALFDRPGAATSRPAKPSRDTRPQRAVRTVRPAMIDGRLRVEVELYDGVCDGEERIVDKGWVPLRDASGALLFWYWSRGC